MNSIMIVMQAVAALAGEVDKRNIKLRDQFGVVEQTFTANASNWQSQSFVLSRDGLAAIRKNFYQPRFDVLYNLVQYLLKVVVDGYFAIEEKNRREIDGFINGLPYGGMIQDAIKKDPRSLPVVNIPEEYHYNQFNYPMPVYEYPGNVGCAATAWAMVMSFRTGEAKSPLTYFPNGQCNWAGVAPETSTVSNRIEEKEQNIFNRAYQCLLQGKPCVVGRNGAHFVCVYGIREGANPANLTSADFLVIDPAGGEKKLLSEANFSGQTINQIEIPA